MMVMMVVMQLLGACTHITQCSISFELVHTRTHRAISTITSNAQFSIELHETISNSHNSSPSSLPLENNLSLSLLLNTCRYSGISEKTLQNVTRTLRDVQAVLLSMFNSKSILVGHSLESDFKALKLIHDCVVDTSILFPHKMGPPKKRALKTLCIENLKRIIQEDGKHRISEHNLFSIFPF